MDLLDKLIERRKRLGVSQTELAQALGVTRVTIARYETKSSEMTLGTYSKVVEYFDKLEEKEGK